MNEHAKLEFLVNVCLNQLPLPSCLHAPFRVLLLRAERHLAETRCMTFFLLTSYIILPSVSYTIFSMFSCEEFDDGAYLLRVDYQIRCQGVWYRFYFILAVLAAIFVSFFSRIHFFGGV